MHRTQHHFGFSRLPFSKFTEHKRFRCITNAPSFAFFSIRKEGVLLCAQKWQLLQTLWESHNLELLHNSNYVIATAYERE